MTKAEYRRSDGIRDGGVHALEQAASRHRLIECEEHPDRGVHGHYGPLAAISS